LAIHSLREAGFGRSKAVDKGRVDRYAICRRSRYGDVTMAWNDECDAAAEQGDTKRICSKSSWNRERMRSVKRQSREEQLQTLDLKLSRASSARKASDFTAPAGRSGWSGRLPGFGRLRLCYRSAPVDRRRFRDRRHAGDQKRMTLYDLRILIYDLVIDDSER
jgi:hypothetical protein